MLVHREKGVEAVELPSGRSRWRAQFSRDVRNPKLNAAGTHCVVVCETPKVIETEKGTVVSEGKFPAPKNIHTYGEILLSDDGRTLVSHVREEREIRWWTAEGEIVKAQTYPQAFLPNQGGLAISSNARRAYLWSGNHILVLSPDRGVEKDYAFHASAMHEVRMQGDFAMVQLAGGSALLRHVPPGGK